MDSAVARKTNTLSKEEYLSRVESLGRNLKNASEKYTNSTLTEEEKEDLRDGLDKFEESFTSANGRGDHVVAEKLASSMGIDNMTHGGAYFEIPPGTDMIGLFQDLVAKEDNVTLTRTSRAIFFAVAVGLDEKSSSLFIRTVLDYGRNQGNLHGRGNEHSVYSTLRKSFENRADEVNSMLNESFGLLYGCTDTVTVQRLQSSVKAVKG